MCAAATAAAADAAEADESCAFFLLPLLLILLLLLFVFWGLLSVKEAAEADKDAAEEVEVEEVEAAAAAGCGSCASCVTTGARHAPAASRANAFTCRSSPFTTPYGLPDIARHVIYTQVVNPTVLRYTAPQDVASNICEALPRRRDPGAGARRSLR